MFVMLLWVCIPTGQAEKFATAFKNLGLKNHRYKLNFLFSKELNTNLGKQDVSLHACAVKFAVLLVSLNFLLIKFHAIYCTA